MNYVYTQGLSGRINLALRAGRLRGGKTTTKMQRDGFSHFMYAWRPSLFWNPQWNTLYARVSMFKEIFVRTPVKRTRIFARRWLNVRGGSERERLIVPLTPLLGTAVPVDCRKTEVKRDPAGWLSLPPPGPAGISGRASPSSSWHHHSTHTARARARARSLVASSGGAPITERLGRRYPPVFIFSRLWWRW